MNTETVKFRIRRKWAFAGALLPYRLCINGEAVGSLKNGKTLCVEVPKSEIYYIDDLWAGDERNAVLRTSASRIDIELRRAGGWKTNSYQEFYVRSHGAQVKLPSFDFSRFYTACYHDDVFSELTEAEKVLTRCLNFSQEIWDGADTILCSDKLFEMLDALEAIGAQQYSRAFSTIIDRLFSEISLPITDEMLEDDDIMKRTHQANKMARESEKSGAAKEFHKCLVHYLIEHFCRSEQRDCWV